LFEIGPKGIKLIEDPLKKKKWNYD
jgi:hypothetical protein